MKKYKIKLFDLRDEDTLLIKYNSRVVPETGDEIEVAKNNYLHVEHRVFNSNDSEDIKLYGYIDEAG